MTSSIAIIDYGAGNLESVRKALELVGAEPIVARHPEDLRRADRYVLPGVGAAGEALAALRREGLDLALDEAVRVRARPLLGICLGMQLLAERHFEFGEHRGLGWIAGQVIHLGQLAEDDIRVPHMGWNSIDVVDDAAAEFFADIRGRRDFYFAHSYALEAAPGSCVVGTCDYGATVPAVILNDTVFATQFHPEKSQVNGEKLLAAFLEWTP